MKLRPLGDGILVRLDPLPEKQGLLFIPGGSRVRTGEVLEVGPGRPTKSGARRPLGLEVGERIAFFREHFEHRPGKELVRSLAELEEDLGLLHVADVLFVLPPGWQGTLA
jgi:co-chaperonin GroES (HSP10)